MRFSVAFVIPKPFMEVIPDKKLNFTPKNIPQKLKKFYKHVNNVNKNLI
jgi:hypothetical protein